MPAYALTAAAFSAAIAVLPVLAWYRLDDLLNSAALGLLMVRARCAGGLKLMLIQPTED